MVQTVMRDAYRLFLGLLKDGILTDGTCRRGSRRTWSRRSCAMLIDSFLGC